MAGKCPGCGNVVASVRAEAIEVRSNNGTVWHGVSYFCPNIACQLVLGVGVDPLALKTDTVNGVLRGLGKKI